ncbi:potassium channel family protein [Lacinutrix jangbogonensis]|uniref:potassium channel family protein n=1 Tax=Lacinutrix jangbogonensis TaxID=1469557 RepID=UPI00053CEF8C|nr:potassium channel family protein [Lacinutrix jangbogonensis]
MLEKLNKYRLGIFFVSQMIILFGSLLIPSEFLESVIISLFFLINILAGIVLVSKNKRLIYLFFGLFILLIIDSIFRLDHKYSYFNYFKMGGYFIFYSIVTIQIIKQVWEAKIVDRSVIFGLISGYISLGLIGFFICLAVELTNPGSFQGVRSVVANADVLTERLLYFSYITLMTIGYGDITPKTPIAQKATILIGLVGQIYLVVLTAIVVGKYINQSLQTNEKK